MAKKPTVVDVNIASLSDLGFKHGQLDATLGQYAEYALKVFGPSFPTVKKNDPAIAEKVGELASGYLSYWATLPRNTPTVYIIVEAGQTATWVPETPANKDAKGERVEITQTLCRSLGRLGITRLPKRFARVSRRTCLRNSRTFRLRRMRFKTQMARRGRAAQRLIRLRRLRLSRKQW